SLGRRRIEVVRSHYARCRALIFPGEEDFGIVPVEAMASGRPVIAFGRGGATESVVHQHTGYLFNEQTADALACAVATMGDCDVDPVEIASHARRFSPDRFKREITGIIEDAIAGYGIGTSQQRAPPLSAPPADDLRCCDHISVAGRPSGLVPDHVTR